MTPFRIVDIEDRRATARYLAELAALALAYILTGRLGLLLAMPPGYATVIWPPSGIAITALLMRGARLWPGILIGSFVVNCYISGAFSLTDGFLPAKTLAAFGIAVGSTLQALAAYALVKRFVGLPLRFARVSEVIRLFLLSSPLACVIAATIGIGTLLLLGLLPPDKALGNWFTWWVGDAFGVVVFLPLGLIAPGSRNRITWRGNPLGTLPVVVMLTTTVFAAAVGFAAYRQNMRLVEAGEWVIHTHQVIEHIDNYLEAANKISIGQKGYFLTGDAGYRELYESALHDAPVQVSLDNSGAYPYSITQEMRILRIMTADNPRQQDNLVHLDKATQNLLTYMSATIEAYDKGGAQALAGDVAVLRSKALMDAIRSITGDMRVEEERLLKKRVFVDAEANKQNWKLFVGIIIIFYLSMLTLVWLLTRIMARLDESNLALKESEKQHRILVEGVQDYAIYWLDPDGVVASWNKGAERLKGYRPEEIVGKNFSEFYPEGDRAKGVPQHNLQIAVSEGKFSGEGWRLRKNGSLFWASVLITPLHDDGGKLIGFSKITRDISESKKAEKALAESNNLNNAIMASASYMIIATDVTGRVISYNYEAEKELGYKASEVLGQRTTAIWHDRDEISKRAEELSEEVGRTVEPGFDVFTTKPRLEGVEKREWTYIRINGSSFPVLLTVTVLHDKSGEITGYLEVAENITEQKKIEHIKSEFTSIVSHELRTPLTSIRGALGLINGGVAGVLPPKAKDLTKIAYESCERLIRIINDILDIGKLESGKMEMVIRPVEVRTLFRQALDANQAYGEKYGVRFILKGEPPAVSIMADAERLMQVFANLLSNAAKFSPKGGEVHVYAEDRGDGKIRFYVQDFGSGIPVAFRSRVFEKFAQAEDVNLRSHDGTGLGLAIVKNFIAAMKGSLDFSTETNVGTTFYFDLPVARDEKLESPESLQHPKTERPFILICADDSDVTQSLKAIIHNAGLDYEAAPSMTIAQQKLQEKHFSAIVLDLMIEQGNGIDFLRTLKSGPESTIPPVVIVCGNIDEDKKMLNGDAIGIVDWLTKPIDEAKLIHCLKQAIAGKTRPRILHVEDDINFMQVIDRALEGEVELVMAPSLREAKEQLKGADFDLVILDIGMPDGSGFELLGQWGTLTSRPTPVVILSASEVDRDVHENVAAALVKSRVSETKITDTILALVHNNQHPAQPINDAAVAATSK